MSEVRNTPHVVSRYLTLFLCYPAWVSYLNIAVLIGTLSLALFNASKDQIARNFAYIYAAISVGVLVRDSSTSRPSVFILMFVVISLRFMDTRFTSVA